MIFVHTRACFSLIVRNDRNHRRAREFLASNPDEELVTTDSVVDELLTWLKVRREVQRALMFGPELFESRVARLEWVLQRDVKAAWDVFRRFQDKEWSFTDCVSSVIFVRLVMDRAFAFDEHFHQFGTVDVEPR